MPKKYLLPRLIVLCLTILASLWLIRDSLCEVRITHGSNEYAAFLNYEVKR
ncbi:Hok/Gef family protein [Winslowiella iniecta]|uniref:Small toxic polypeptide n=1 Tax=Winslowiella iniecta TaxID=1560201 RepID=A0A0L7TAQ4_9GAMM|nr:Hok/Gef family protein [Winslowiella iniecta]KOC85793.1 small toxic polypeptide [Winslowiella iniecta]KOC92370.1 small toxic polypeptide [Winslowiella iniecta]KOC92442.1 small toxic polypeptide [Winslowiella iniecta]